MEARTTSAIALSAAALTAAVIAVVLFLSASNRPLLAAQPPGVLYPPFDETICFVKCEAVFCKGKTGDDRDLCVDKCIDTCWGI